jgi:hypothetical protein
MPLAWHAIVVMPYQIRGESLYIFGQLNVVQFALFTFSVQDSWNILECSRTYIHLNTQNFM